MGQYLTSQTFTRLRVNNSVDSEPVEFVLGADSRVVINATDTTHTDTGGVTRAVLKTATADVINHNSIVTLTADVDGVASYKSSITGHSGGSTSGNITNGFISDFNGDNDDVDHNYVSFNADDFKANGGGGTAIGLRVGTSYDKAVYAESGTVSHACSLLQSVGVETIITPTNKNIRVEGSGGAVLLASTPNIAVADDGTEIVIIGANNIKTLELQDETNLVGSGLRLAGGLNVVLGLYDTLSLVYDATVGYWLETSRSNN